MAESDANTSLQALVRELGRLVGVSMGEGEAAEVAAIYAGYQELIAILDAVDLPAEEESPAVIDLADWGSPPNEPVARIGQNPL
jgi:hypothetical protein